MHLKTATVAEIDRVGSIRIHYEDLEISFNGGCVGDPGPVRRPLAEHVICLSIGDVGQIVPVRFDSE